MTRYVLFIRNGDNRLTATSSKESIIANMFERLRNRLKEGCLSILVSKENVFGCIDASGNSREIKFEKYSFDVVDPYKLIAYTL